MSMYPNSCAFLFSLLIIPQTSLRTLRNQNRRFDSLSCTTFLVYVSMSMNFFIRSERRSSRLRMQRYNDFFIPPNLFNTFLQKIAKNTKNTAKTAKIGGGNTPKVPQKGRVFQQRKWKDMGRDCMRKSEKDTIVGAWPPYWRRADHSIVPTSSRYCLRPVLLYMRARVCAYAFINYSTFGNSFPMSLRHQPVQKHLKKYWFYFANKE